MAQLRTSGMINPQLLSKYVSESITTTNTFFKQGIVEFSQELLDMIKGGGKTGKMPFYKHLTGDDEVLGDDTSDALTVGGTTTGEEIYAVLARGRSFGASDLAKAFSGDDPMKAIGNMVAEYWSEKYNQTLIASLTGVIAGSGAAGLVHDISGVGDGKITLSGVVDGKAKLGDKSNKLVGIAMHSAVKAKLDKDQLIVYLRGADYNITSSNFMGMEVIVDDALPYVSGTGVYTSFLLAKGAVAYAGNAAPIPFETDRDVLAGSDILVSRSHHVIHPRGFKINVSGITGETPSNAELATDIWTKVFETKNCGFVAIKHKV